MPFASALSAHPVAAHAVGEVCGLLLESHGPSPDLVVLVASASHTGALEDIVPAVRAILRPRHLLGATAGTVLCGNDAIADAPALSLWAAWFDGTGADGVTPVRLGSRLGPTDVPVDDATCLMVLADPFSTDADGFLAETARRHPHLTVVGGFASAARGPGGNRLVLDGAITTDGAVGVLLAGTAAPTVVVAPACRPIGEPFTVTATDGEVLLSLGGRPAMERFAAVVQALPPDDHPLARRGLRCGIVAVESGEHPGVGDVLAREVIGLDRTRGGVAVTDRLPVGATVQFQLVDPDVLDRRLLELLLPRVAAGGAALVSTAPEVAPVVAATDALVGAAAVAGLAGPGQFGPIGGGPSARHQSAAVVAVFGPG